MKQRTDIERQFNILKDKGLEQPRLFGFNSYLLHVQLSIFMHNLDIYSFFFQHHKIESLILSMYIRIFLTLPLIV